MGKAYEERLSEISSAWREIEPDLLEAEALWGWAAIDAVRELRQAHGELVPCGGEYLWTKNPNPQSWQTVDRSPKRLERLEKVVFLGRDPEDTYLKELVNAVAPGRKSRPAKLSI
jgi:hypothetical protein